MSIRRLPPLTGEATTVLKALAKGGRLSAGRVFPHPHRFTLRRAGQHRDGTPWAPQSVSPSTVATLLDRGLIVAAPRDPSADLIDYRASEGGVAAVERGAVDPDTSRDQLDLMGVA